MTQEISLHQDTEHQHDALWWKPLLSMQQQTNNAMQDAFSKSPIGSFLPSTFWNEEENTVSAMQENMHKLFGQMFNNRQMLTPLSLGKKAVPFIDIVENGKSFKMKAEIVGLDAEDIDISISDSALTISGEKQESKTEEGDTYIRQECHSGSFKRIIAFPEEADLKNAKAKFENSVLTIEVPKKQQASENTRKIKIEGEVKNKPKSAKQSEQSKQPEQPKPTKQQPEQSKQPEQPKQPELVSNDGGYSSKDKTVKTA